MEINPVAKGEMLKLKISRRIRVCLNKTWNTVYSNKINCADFTMSYRRNENTITHHSLLR